MKLGEEILKCQPFAYIVNRSQHNSICDFCLADTSSGVKLLKCSKCKYVYYCNRQCQRPAWTLHREECQYLTAVSPNFPTDTVRLIARILLKLKMGGCREIAMLPDGSRRAFQDLMTHSHDIVRDKCRIEAFHCFFEVLRELFQDKIPPKSEVLDIYGCVLTNSFNIMNHEYQSVGIGLYLAASAFDHSCEPNATVNFEGRHLVVRSIVSDPTLTFKDIRISYVNPIWKTSQRKEKLRSQYYFDCNCSACDDENGYESQKNSCLKCPSCGHGIVWPENCETITHCGICTLEVPRDHVNKYLNLKAKILEIVRIKSGEEQEREYEELYQDLFEVFHPSEQTYFDVLEILFDHFLQFERFNFAYESVKELLSAYEIYYPQYDINKGLMFLKAAKLAFFLESIYAKNYIDKAAEILSVTHGKNHRLYQTEVIPLAKQIESKN